MNFKSIHFLLICLLSTVYSCTSDSPIVKEINSICEDGMISNASATDQASYFESLKSFQEDPLESQDSILFRITKVNLRLSSKWILNFSSNDDLGGLELKRFGRIHADSVSSDQLLYHCNILLTSENWENLCAQMESLPTMKIPLLAGDLRLSNIGYAIEISDQKILKKDNDCNQLFLFTPSFKGESLSKITDDLEQQFFNLEKYPNRQVLFERYTKVETEIISAMLERTLEKLEKEMEIIEEIVDRSIKLTGKTYLEYRDEHNTKLFVKCQEIIDTRNSFLSEACDSAPNCIPVCLDLEKQSFDSLLYSSISLTGIYKDMERHHLYFKGYSENLIHRLRNCY